MRNALTRLSLTMAAFALVAAACGNNGDDSAGAPDDPTPALTAAPTAALSAGPEHAVIPTVGVELPGDPATPDPADGPATATATADPTVPPLPTGVPAAAGPDQVVCDAEAGELPYDSDSSGTADTCKNPETGEVATVATPTPTDAPEPTPAPTSEPIPVPTAAPTPAPTARPTPTAAPEPPPPVGVRIAEIAEEAFEGSTFGGAISWDSGDGLRPVVNRIPVGDVVYAQVLNHAGAFDGRTGDTLRARQWVQDCVRGYAPLRFPSHYHVDATRLKAIEKLDGGTPEGFEEFTEYQVLRIYASASHRAARSCFAAHGTVAQYLARYWWGDYSWDGPAGRCLSDAVLHVRVGAGPEGPHPLEMCPSAVYDPHRAPAPAADLSDLIELCRDTLKGASWTDEWCAPEWADMIARCHEIVEANPNAGLPDHTANPYATYLRGQPAHEVPTCTAQFLGGALGQAAGRGDLPGSPHNCYQSAFGQVLARQRGDEQRSLLETGLICDYYRTKVGGG